MNGINETQSTGNNETIVETTTTPQSQGDVTNQPIANTNGSDPVSPTTQTPDPNQPVKQEGEGEGNETKQWKEGDPFHLHPDIIEMKRELAQLRDEKSKGFQTTESKGDEAGKSSSQPDKTQQQTDVNDVPDEELAPLFEGLPERTFSENQFDEAGNLVKSGYDSWGAVYADFRKSLIKDLTLINENGSKIQNQKVQEEEQKYESVVEGIQKSFGNDSEGFKQFEAYATKKYNEGSKMDIFTMLEVFRNYEYKKPPVSDQTNIDTSKRVAPQPATGNNKADSLPMNVISNTSIMDL
jgi:hypothetical protein